MQHWHVTEFNSGCLLEELPSTFVDAEAGIDALAHLLKDWANTFPNPEDPAAVYADGTAEHYCTCRQGERSAEHHDAMVAVEDGRGVSEQIGCRVFELSECQDRDCLKCCPSVECRTVTSSVTDPDERCWRCGADYIGWEMCNWLADRSPRGESGT